MAGPRTAGLVSHSRPTAAVQADHKETAFHIPFWLPIRLRLSISRLGLAIALRRRDGSVGIIRIIPRLLSIRRSCAIGILRRRRAIGIGGLPDRAPVFRRGSGKAEGLPAAPP